LAERDVIPWRRRHAEKLADLEVHKRELDNRKQEDELAFHDLEYEQRRLDVARQQFELAKSKWELAERMLKELDPENRLRGRDRAQGIARGVAGIDQLGGTRLEFKRVHEIQSQ